MGVGRGVMVSWCQECGCCAVPWATAACNWGPRVDAPEHVLVVHMQCAGIAGADVLQVVLVDEHTHGLARVVCGGLLLVVPVRREQRVDVVGMSAWGARANVPSTASCQHQQRTP